MNQFFFGSADKPLYGVHHPPQIDQLKDTAVLICYPIGREYMRCHRALVKLCDRFAKLGYHSMRFDYYGTGDSAGDFGAGSVDEWLANIQSASQELRDVSGLHKISIVGVRIGAALATYAVSKLDSVETLLLWDPIPNGAQYLDKMTEMHKEFVMDLDRFPKRRSVQVHDASAAELIGMQIGGELRDSFKKIDLAMIESVRARNTAIVVTDDRPQYRDSLRHLEALVGRDDYHFIDEPSAWDVLSDLGVVMMPHEVLGKIVTIMDV